MENFWLTEKKGIKMQESIKLSEISKCRTTRKLLSGLLVLMFSNVVLAVDKCGDYPSDGNPFPCSNGGNCTWWAWKMAKDSWGIDFPARGNANTWDDTALNKNYITRTVPMPGNIAQKNSSPYKGDDGNWYDYGHVAFVTDVNYSTKTVYWSEMNYGSWGVKNRSGSFSSFDNYISSPNTPEFHGAGSLISPEKNCYGCNADLDALHADGQAGLVLFQWYHTPDRCDHIDISVSNMSYALPVKIRSGSWDSRINDKHFVAKLPTSIDASGGSSPWNVTAITFDPLTMPGIVTAKCSVSSKVGTPFSYAPVATETQGIALANGWTWQGNGSLISSLAPGASGYGVTQDVVNLTSEKGAAFFQWQKTFYCKNLQISAKIAGNYKLRLRGWNASPDNRVMTRDMSLSSFATDVLDAGEVSGSTDGYYLLSVYPDISVNMSTVNPINVSCKSY